MCAREGCGVNHPQSYSGCPKLSRCLHSGKQSEKLGAEKQLGSPAEVIVSSDSESSSSESSPTRFDDIGVKLVAPPPSSSGGSSVASNPNPIGEFCSKSTFDAGSVPEALVYTDIP